MPHLTVYREHDAVRPEVITGDPAVLAGHLAMAGILLERWTAEPVLPADADTAAVLSAYAAPIQRLQRVRGYQSVDVVRMPRGTPDAAALRAKFLDEHTHTEDEARFFVEGSGAFYLHMDGRVFRVVCEAGDLLSVPAGTRHWFDMGPEPHLTAIRFFTRPDGWVAESTGDPISARFPGYEGVVNA
ncbi:1,2-dihydroxy-3-keto-5-methylthiopentene dioxygenase [Azospirillum doebereinerae]|uniref:Acireductone dioxygenase n=1 Tax=Azospirillum doebereinerae TaxID=92933 RepID=A0A433JAR0_9PROT|nr:cupin domain-containing protein [Azospirillum doebereinerae]MCG5242092.1 cupin domain-containing protein [Azospirillum doebereinerae]RUQ72958.1 cupin domain-containing protein [Azospirillum doebereinerae]